MAPMVAWPCNWVWDVSGASGNGGVAKVVTRGAMLSEAREVHFQDFL